MTRIRTTAIALAVSTLLVAALAQPAQAGTRRRVSLTFASARLADLSPSTADVTDGAHATAFAVAVAGKDTHVVFLLNGLDRSLSGGTYGAHVHTGSCVAGDGAAAGPHYNATGGAVINTDTEIWLDITVSRFGTGFASASVPFVIPHGGANSIVVHAMPTSSVGAAGARLACLQIAF